MLFARINLRGKCIKFVLSNVCLIKLIIINDVCLYILMLARNSYLLAYYCLSNNNIYRVYHVRKFTLPQRIEKMDETSLQIVTIHPNSTWFHSSQNMEIRWKRSGGSRARSRRQSSPRSTSTSVIDNRFYHDTHSCPLSLLPSSSFHV